MYYNSIFQQCKHFQHFTTWFFFFSFSKQNILVNESEHQKQDFMTPKSTICYGSISSAKIPKNQSPEYSPASEFCYATKSVAFYLQLWVWQFLGYLTDNICTKTCKNTDVVCLVRIHVFIRSFNSCISYDVNKNMSLNL